MPDVSFMNERHAARRVDDRAQQVEPGLRTHATARAHQHPDHECYGNDGKGGDFRDAHDRLLIVVVRYGRGARLVDRIRAECEAAHTFARKADFINSNPGDAPCWDWGLADSVAATIGRGRGPTATSHQPQRVPSHSALAGKTSAVTSSGTERWGSEGADRVPEYWGMSMGKLGIPGPPQFRHRGFNISSFTVHSRFINDRSWP